MLPLAVLGKVDIPAHIEAILPAAFDSWPRERRSVWEIQQKRGWEYDTSGRQYLGDDAAAFVDETLTNLGISIWEPEAHTLILFEDVEKHRDDGVSCQGRQGLYFHIVLEGSGVLHLPGVTDKSLRSLKLEKGLAFWFNPDVYHAVSGASPGGIATLSATIRVTPDSL